MAWVCMAASETTRKLPISFNSTASKTKDFIGGKVEGQYLDFNPIEHVFYS